MRTLWRGLGRIFFWSYERGSWPYDVMVIAIVIFVLLTPRSWFHDDPHSTAAAAAPGVALLSADVGDQTRTYRIDATVLAPEKRQTKSTPELERETHEILGRTVAELKDQTFQVRGIEPVLAGDGGVLYYDVTVHP
jgi:hypothetical protein